MRAAAQTFRQNPAIDTETAITELGVGEALVSTLGGKGTPGIVERALIRPPSSRLGPATPSEREAIIAQSLLGKRYDKSVDSRSAYEMLRERAEKAAVVEEREVAAKPKQKSRGRGGNRQGVMEAMVKSVVRSVGSSLGRSIARGILGSILKG